jgi:hypothetical protein
MGPTLFIARITPVFKTSKRFATHRLGGMTAYPLLTPDLKNAYAKAKAFDGAREKGESEFFHRRGPRIRELGRRDQFYYRDVLNRFNMPPSSKMSYEDMEGLVLASERFVKAPKDRKIEEDFKILVGRMIDQGKIQV